MQIKTYIAIVIFSTLVIEGISAISTGTYTCPSGFPRVYCYVDPCSKAECSGDPNAKCIALYCGGCNAVWLTSDGQLAQCAKCKCPPGQDEVVCTKDPCDGATCPGDSTAKCYSNYCGGCNAVWLTPDNKPANCGKASNCPENKNACYTNPCKGQICDRYPDAKGTPNYCEGCECDWSLPDGTKVTCLSTTS